MIVLDSSAAVDLILRRRPADWVEELLAGDGDVHAPAVVDIEVAGAVRRVVLHRGLPARDGRAALDAFASVPLARHEHVPLLPRIWELHAHLTAGDAAFVALAETLGAPLVTTDRALARAHGHSARILTPA